MAVMCAPCCSVPLTLSCEHICECSSVQWNLSKMVTVLVSHLSKQPASLAPNSTKALQSQSVRTGPQVADLDRFHYAASTLHYTTLHYTTLHYTTLYYTTVMYSTVQYSTLQYTKLNYTTLHYTTLQYSAYV